MAATPDELTAAAPGAGPSPSAAVAAGLPETGTLLRDQVRGTFAFNRTSLVGHAVGAVVVVLLFLETAPATLLLAWATTFALVWLTRVVMALRYARREARTSLGLATRLRAWQIGVLAAGALWGAAGWFFYPHGSALQRLALVLVVYTFCVASVPILAPLFRLFVAFVLLVFTPAIVAVATSRADFSIELAIVMTVAMGMIVVLGRNYRESFERTVSLKLATEALAGKLRAEMVVSENARREAEVANRAKTQFFAAASHDLRQPLHAMGLFAEALRARSHEGEVAHLVNSINESVDALEGLFSELLDITKIDSGGVEVRPQSFAAGDIFRKLRLHFEPAAFEKGLELRFRGHRHVGHADPLLVERILRNLVSNAIRYTEDGTVLASARPCGDRIRLQVWDTGPGIGDAEKAKVFEEFYQVPGRATTVEQKKGLGLGLAIVKRLSGLMQAPVAMRSEVGHGTVFTLEVPKGTTVAPAPGLGSATAKAAITLEGRRIVVVEDERAVREGLEVLLRGWGATIDSFESVQAARAWAGSLPADAPAPALAIVDYRLEPGETGIGAITALRARFGRSLPAIIVTGSVMTGHEREAQENDFHLLVKPVLPNKLRAMIAFKLARQAEPLRP